MPDTTTLTLHLDADVAARARRYARAHGLSVSALVEGYFAALEAPAVSHGEIASLPPITARLADRPPAPEALTMGDYHRHLDAASG